MLWLVLVKLSNSITEHHLSKRRDTRQRVAYLVLASAPLHQGCTKINTPQRTISKIITTTTSIITRPKDLHVAITRLNLHLQTMGGSKT